MKNSSCKRAVVVSFMLTLIICSFLLLSGLALHNTATAMFGTDQSVLEITAAETTPHLDITFFETKYKINLSGANRAAGGMEQNYALFPRKFRLLQTFFDGLKEGFAYLF